MEDIGFVEVPREAEKKADGEKVVLKEDESEWMRVRTNLLRLSTMIMAKMN